jgi:hypothetical protein
MESRMTAFCVFLAVAFALTVVAVLIYNVFAQGRVDVQATKAKESIITRRRRELERKTSRTNRGAQQHHGRIVNQGRHRGH